MDYYIKGWGGKDPTPKEPPRWDKPIHRKYYKIWIDTERPVPTQLDGEFGAWAQHYDEAIWMLTNTYNPDKWWLWLDFDYDLGRGKTGMDLAKWLVENNFRTDSFSIHAHSGTEREEVYNFLTYHNWEWLPAAYYL